MLMVYTLLPSLDNSILMEPARLRLMEDLSMSLEQTKIISKELLTLDREVRVNLLTKISCMGSLMRYHLPLISTIQS